MGQYLDVWAVASSYKQVLRLFASTFVLILTFVVRCLKVFCIAHAGHSFIFVVITYAALHFLPYVSVHLRASQGTSTVTSSFIAKHMPRVLFIFIDGVGLGPNEAENPLAASNRPLFERLAAQQTWTRDARPVHTSRHVFAPIDATLGIKGLPQSGTGQATLFTGINCAEIVGRHFGPYPHSKTHDTLSDFNIFSQVNTLLGTRSAAFANAYPPRFFDFAASRNRWTVTTYCCKQAGLHIRGLDDIERGRAVTADLTGEGWHQIGHGIDLISEREAGARLHRISQSHALTLFEYYLTDKAGHGRTDHPPSHFLDALEQFLGGVMSAFDPVSDLLIITSDHGNIEDPSIKTHTRNPVPLIAYGQGAHHFAQARSLMDVTPAILQALRDDPPSAIDWNGAFGVDGN